jgi:Na+-transporting methylmalonyl-CoA/oxaloacetate decarboxylase beta subunit
MRLLRSASNVRRTGLSQSLLRPVRKPPFGPIPVAAYSYMSLVPIIQAPVIKALTTKRTYDKNGIQRSKVTAAGVLYVPDLG